MFEKLKELRKREEGLTMVEALIYMVLLSILTVAVLPAIINATHANTNAIERDTTIAGSPVAVELRDIQLQASRCIATRDAEPQTYGTYTSGSYWEEITRPDIQTCVDVVTPSATLVYEIKRSNNNFVCVVGYDTTRDTEKYNVNTPYIYYSPTAIIYKDSITPCGYSPAEGQSFNWEEMR